VDIQALLDTFTGWASLRPDIKGVALAGSCARDVANEESDVDLIILTKQSERYLSDPAWASAFGEVGERKVEDWGRVKSLRVFYKDGLEVEYGFAFPDWADIPVDSGTLRVVSNGMRILIDPTGILTELQQQVSATLRVGER
jgi:predicted nucleotidyltransferase